MEFRILAIIATVMDVCTGPSDRRRGHPPAATVRVLATLRQFLREARRGVASARAWRKQAARRCAAILSVGYSRGC